MTGFDISLQKANSIIINAADMLNKYGRGNFTIKSVKDFSAYSFMVVVVDNDMKKRMDEKRSSFHFLDYIPEFKVEIGKSYFTNNRLEPFDSAVKISGKDLDLDTKALIRCAWRIAYINNNWRAKIFYNHQELK